MKKISIKILGFFFYNFYWYRKWSGGTWYKVRDDVVSGIASPNDYWTRDPGRYEIIEKEDHREQR